MYVEYSIASCCLGSSSLHLRPPGSDESPLCVTSHFPLVLLGFPLFPPTPCLMTSELLLVPCPPGSPAPAASVPQHFSGLGLRGALPPTTLRVVVFWMFAWSSAVQGMETLVCSLTGHVSTAGRAEVLLEQTAAFLPRVGFQYGLGGIRTRGSVSEGVRPWHVHRTAIWGTPRSLRTHCASALRTAAPGPEAHHLPGG